MSDVVYRRRDDAADYVQKKYGIPCTKQALAKYAVVGGGPEFRKIGRWPVYEDAALDAWVAERLSKPVRSTSELAAA